MNDKIRNKINDIFAPLSITLKEAILGAEKTLEIDQLSLCSECKNHPDKDDPCVKCGGTGFEKKSVQLKIKVPAGVDSRDRIRFAGEGNKLEEKHSQGDVYAEISIQKDPKFTRNKMDLYTECMINSNVANSGGKIKITGFDKQYILALPENTKSNQTFRLAGGGIKSISSDNVGDLYCRIIVANDS